VKRFECPIEDRWPETTCPPPPNLIRAAGACVRWIRLQSRGLSFRLCACIIRTWYRVLSSAPPLEKSVDRVHEPRQPAYAYSHAHAHAHAHRSSAVAIDFDDIDFFKFRRDPLKLR